MSVHGIYDMHMFHRYEGATVDELVDNWIAHIANPIPAIVGGVEYADIGPTALCPAIVMCGDKELRRVGPMVHTRDRKPKPEDVEIYKAALLADPDIPRLLAKTGGRK